MELSRQECAHFRWFERYWLCSCQKFTQAGANVTILARREDLLKKACQDLEALKVSNSQHIAYIPADVSDFKSLETAYKKANMSFDVLVNCAGIAYPGEFINLQPEIYDEVIKIDFLGTVYLTKLVVPGMVEKRAGYVVNISSLAAIIGIYGYTAYASSKYAVRGFSRCLRSELKAYGIDVSVVFPPDTDTPQLKFERSIIPAITLKINSGGGVMSPDKVADAILHGMERRQFSIFRVLRVSFYALSLPSSVVFFIAWQSGNKKRSFHKKIIISCDLHLVPH
jgi:3-dehydrosphinganine reductase